MIRQRKRIPTKRATPRVIHPERSGGHHRVRLHGKAREQRRAEVFERAGGRCEEKYPAMVPSIGGDLNGEWMIVRCPNRATEWSHIRHGSNKCDCFSPDCNIASCHECHRKRHAGGNGKPCPPKVKQDLAAV